MQRLLLSLWLVNLVACVPENSSPQASASRSDRSNSSNDSPTESETATTANLDEQDICCESFGIGSTGRYVTGYRWMKKSQCLPPEGHEVSGGGTAVVDVGKCNAIPKVKIICCESYSYCSEKKCLEEYTWKTEKECVNLQPENPELGVGGFRVVKDSQCPLRSYP